MDTTRRIASLISMLLTKVFDNLIHNSPTQATKKGLYISGALGGTLGETKSNDINAVQSREFKTKTVCFENLKQSRSNVTEL